MKNLLLILIGLCLIVAACSKKESETFDHFFFRNDGADLFVEVNGNIASKTFLLFLHGGPGGGGTAYNSGYYADELEKEYAMVYMDQRGNGASTGNYDKGTLTLAQNSDDIYQLTRFLKAKYGQDISLFLAGHSWGGLTTCHALVTTDIQQEIKGWIEIDGAHDFVLNDRESIKLFKVLATIEIATKNNLEFWTPVLERVNEMDTLAPSVEDAGYLNAKAFEAESYLPIEYPELPDSGLPYTSLNAPNSGMSIWFANLVVNPILNADSYENPLTDRLDEISVPSLFLWGKYDLVVPPALGVSAYNLVNTTEKELVIFENSGHSPMSNEPELFVQEVKKFVELYK